jgi:serine/threonine protein kinase
MIKVLYNLKIIKISHLDIKPENILVNESQEK